MKTKNCSLTVEALARLSGVRAHTIRYYTRRGLLDPQRNPANAYRIYSDADLARLRFIQQAKSIGFSLGDIGKVLASGEAGDSSRGIVESIIKRRVAENRRRLRELTALQKRMESAAEQLARLADGGQDVETIHDLIKVASA